MLHELVGMPELRTELRLCSLAELELLICGIASECCHREAPGAAKLFEVARGLERKRLGLAPAEKS
jgi:hypothetical protein